MLTIFFTFPTGLPPLLVPCTKMVYNKNKNKNKNKNMFISINNDVTNLHKYIMK